MKRAIIIVKGYVQRVGYGDQVENIARKLGVTGFVENVKPYDVRIVAEGEKDSIEKFIQQIKIEDPPILVEKVDVSFEEPTHEFGYFEIKRGDWKEELGERFDLAGKILYGIRGTQRELIGGQKELLNKQKDGIEEMRGFRQDTMQRFDTVDAKYGKIAENMEKAIEAINRTCTNTERLLEKTEKDRKDFRDSIEKLANAILETSKR